MHDVSILGRIARAVIARRGATIARPLGPDATRDLALIRETRGRVPLLVQDAAALQLLACVRAVRSLDGGGAMAEAGVYAGGTARLICEAKGGVPLRLFDVFETLQGSAAVGADDHRAQEVREHFKTLHATQASVTRLLADYPAVSLHAGVFPGTTRGLDRERFAFVHIDLDLETSVGDALEFFHPRLVPGGLILGDDYQDAGVRRAFGRYLAGREDTCIELPWGQVLLVSGAPRR